MAENCVNPKGDILIGKRVKKFRELRSLTQKMLAESVMVSPSSITRLESGQTMVSVFTIMKISEVLKVPVSWILTDIIETELDYSELSGVLVKLNKCKPIQRTALIQYFEQLIDLFFLTE